MTSVEIKTDILFTRPQEERVDFDEKDLVELFPYGLSLSNDSTRPFMILKDKTQDMVLPVPINQIEASLTLTQSNPNLAPVNTHEFSERLLESLNIKLERCVFVEIKGVHQYVRIYMNGHPQYHSMKFRADEVMSLCLHAKVPLFATKSYINRSKVMSAEIIGLAQKSRNNPMLLVKNHNYLM
ncbi:MAG: bifunctional nuclease family protein [Pseudobdellovibrio sp.]